MDEGIKIENEIETKEKTTNPMAAYLLLLFENAMPNTNRTFIAAANGTRKKRGGGPEEEEKLKVMVMELTWREGCRCWVLPFWYSFCDGFCQLIWISFLIFYA